MDAQELEAKFRELLAERQQRQADIAVAKKAFMATLDAASRAHKAWLNQLTEDMALDCACGGVMRVMRVTSNHSTTFYAQCDKCKSRFPERKTDSFNTFEELNAAVDEICDGGSETTAVTA